MRLDYQNWLRSEGYADNTQIAQMHRVKKVEDAYGDLEEHVRNGSLQGVVRELQYSTADERMGRPNPSRLQFVGNIRNNLQSYKNALLRYERFLVGDSSMSLQADSTGRLIAGDEVEPVKQRLALERDLQMALRADITSLDEELQIVDDGAERAVETGFIDILCRNQASELVVVELKAGKADSRSIAQILGYMGDLVAEGEENVRGILVAHEFDKRTKSAARMAGSVKLMRYRVAFQFEED